MLKQICEIFSHPVNLRIFFERAERTLHGIILFLEAQKTYREASLFHEFIQIFKRGFA